MIDSLARNLLASCCDAFVWSTWTQRRYTRPLDCLINWDVLQSSTPSLVKQLDRHTDLYNFTPV